MCEESPRNYLYSAVLMLPSHLYDVRPLLAVDMLKRAKESYPPVRGEVRFWEAAEIHSWRSETTTDLEPLNCFLMLQHFSCYLHFEEFPIL